MSERPDFAKVLAEHRTLANSPSDCVCACDRTWRKTADYRAHLAAALDAEVERVCLDYARTSALRTEAQRRTEAAEAEAAELRATVERVEALADELANPDPDLITPIERAHRRTVARELRAALTAHRHEEA